MSPLLIVTKGKNIKRLTVGFGSEIQRKKRFEKFPDNFRTDKMRKKFCAFRYSFFKIVRDV